MVLMERCSPARRRRPAAATEAAAAALGGGGSLAPLLPCGWCCNGAGPPLQDGGLGGGKFVALGDLGFLSLYRLSDSRHQILGLSKTGFTRPSGLRFGRILYPEASPRNSPQLSQLDFFRLTSYSGRNVTIFKKTFSDRFQESQSPTPIRLLLRFCQFPSNSYTIKCKTRTLCTFATISRLVQI